MKKSYHSRLEPTSPAAISLRRVFCSVGATLTTASPSPRVDERAFLPLGAGSCGGQRGGDPAARVGGVDDVVDLEDTRDVQRFAVFVRAGDHLVVAVLAFLFVVDRVQFAFE